MTSEAPSVKTVRVPVMFWPGTRRIIEDTEHRNLVIFAGVGFGKTYAGPWFVSRRIHLNSNSVRKCGAIVAPTNKLLKNLHFPELKKVLAKTGYFENVHYRFNRQDLVMTFIREVCGFDYTILFISAENYQNVVGWEFDFVWWDEPGFAPEELKRFVDQRTGRSKGAARGQILFTGVVQLVNWYYEMFGASAKVKPTTRYRLPEEVSRIAPGWGGKELVRYRESESSLVFHASSFENRTLPDSYLQALWESFGSIEHLWRAHVIGEAIAINTNAVYKEFEEAASVGNYPPFFYGDNPFMNLAFDFNVGKMTVSLIQQYTGDDFVTWENGDGDETTADAVNTFLKRFPGSKYGNHFVRVYGDQKGWARSEQMKTKDGSYSIIRAMLHKAGYQHVEIMAKKYTIPQETRVMSTRQAFARAAAGKSRGLFIHQACRKVIASARLTSWDPKTGKIAKPQNDNHTHAMEAVDYFKYVDDPPLDLETAVGDGRS